MEVCFFCRVIIGENEMITDVKAKVENNPVNLNREDTSVWTSQIQRTDNELYFVEVAAYDDAGNVTRFENTYNFNTGYVSAQICNENGIFSQHPMITLTLETSYKCFGINLLFAGNLPKRFLVKTYSNNKINSTTDISGQIIEDYILNKEFPEFDKMEIEFIEMSVPNSRVYVDYISLGPETNYTLSYDDLYDTPIGTQLDKIKNVNVVRSIYTTSEILEELTSDTLKYDGENHTYYFSEACYGYEASIDEPVSGESIVIESCGAYFVTVSFIGVDIGTEIKFSVSGHKYNVSTAYRYKEVNSRGNDKEWNNPLISEVEHGDRVAEWLADYFASGIEYTLNHRGEPALDTGDTIFQENKYEPQLKTYIEETQTSFDGTIRGALVTRRKARVDRTKNGLGQH